MLFLERARIGVKIQQALLQARWGQTRSQLRVPVRLNAPILIQLEIGLCNQLRVFRRLVQQNRFIVVIKLRKRPALLRVFFSRYKGEALCVDDQGLIHGLGQLMDDLHGLRAPASWGMKQSIARGQIQKLQAGFFDLAFEITCPSERRRGFTRLC